MRARLVLARAISRSAAPFVLRAKAEVCVRPLVRVYVRLALEVVREILAARV